MRPIKFTLLGLLLCVQACERGSTTPLTAGDNSVDAMSAGDGAVLEDGSIRLDSDLGGDSAVAQTDATREDQGARAGDGGMPQEDGDLTDGGAAGCACPAVIMPVCGTDGVTYDNDCFARCAGVEVARSEVCPENFCRTPDDCGDPGPDCDYGCEDFLCVPRCGPICGPDQSCPRGMMCEEGRCIGELECPDPDDPNIDWYGRDEEVCESLNFACGPGEQLFFDECGCGCIRRGDVPCECPDIVDPVCGADGVTYENDCLAECREIPIISEEACMSPCPHPECGALECPNGFATDADGCQICECAGEDEENLCADYFYRICMLDVDCGGRPGYVCSPVQEMCVPSNCDCDPETGLERVCTPDCIEGVGLCVRGP